MVVHGETSEVGEGKVVVMVGEVEEKVMVVVREDK